VPGLSQFTPRRRKTVSNKSSTKNAERVEHTPGPWAVHFIDRDGKPSLWIYSHDNGTPSRTVVETGALDCWPLSEANAQLIAAAPELLEALEACLADLEHYVSTHGPGPDVRLANAKAAIAKVRGQ